MFVAFLIASLAMGAIGGFLSIGLTNAYIMCIPLVCLYTYLYWKDEK